MSHSPSINKNRNHCQEYGQDRHGFTQVSNETEPGGEKKKFRGRKMEKKRVEREREREVDRVKWCSLRGINKR